MGIDPINSWEHCAEVEYINTVYHKTIWHINIYCRDFIDVVFFQYGMNLYRKRRDYIYGKESKISLGKSEALFDTLN